MARPHVITHTLISVDGKLDGFPPDVGRYYEVAGAIPHDAVLSGSGTMVAAAADAGIDLTQEDGLTRRDTVSPAGGDRPLLVVIDSGGRLTRFEWLRTAGFWREVMVVGSNGTPSEHRDRLRAAGVPFEAIGDDRVDLEAALQHLRRACGVESVRVDAGPGLNRALLDAGLLDEVSVLLAPHLVGGGRGFIDGAVTTGPHPLRLTAVQAQPDGHVWLRYAIAHG